MSETYECEFTPLSPTKKKRRNSHHYHGILSSLTQTHKCECEFRHCFPMSGLDWIWTQLIRIKSIKRAQKLGHTYLAEENWVDRMAKPRAFSFVSKYQAWIQPKGL